MSDVDKLCFEDAVLRFMDYADHRDWCDALDDKPNCDCGYQALRDRLLELLR